ncbi:DUF2018 family protein [Helicobacter sp. TUL]|uniref:DUF2018 family protein n=1 Tax=Helicobacter sp. TUL TaxID=1848928 RepID=UPI000BDA5D5E|nr:DUF2018 family protein [Helicobacter sp. TUL]PAU99743.1 hypothetical protein B9T66_06075 [Helicobacter sp. TUL]
MELDDLEMFGKSPLQKWHEIIRNASPTLVEMELERLLGVISLYELFLESKGVASVDVQKFSLSLDEEQKQEVRDLVDSLAIESMGNILGNHE